MSQHPHDACIQGRWRREDSKPEETAELHAASCEQHPQESGDRRRREDSMETSGWDARTLPLHLLCLHCICCVRCSARLLHLWAAARTAGRAGARPPGRRHAPCGAGSAAAGTDLEIPQRGQQKSPSRPGRGPLKGGNSGPRANFWPESGLHRRNPEEAIVGSWAKRPAPRFLG